MELVDKTKKVGKDLELRQKTELTEDAGKPPISSKLVHDKHPEAAVATYTTKDGETIEMSASQDAQENGDYEKAASKAGVKKEDLKYTSPGMAAAKAYVDAKKDNKDMKKEVLGEKAKLVKADPGELPKNIGALHMDGELDHGETALKHIKLHLKHAGMSDNPTSRMYHHKQAMDIHNHMTGKKKYEPEVYNLDKTVPPVNMSPNLAKAAPKGVDKAKYERCVQDVKAEGGKAKNPWAICAASLQKMSKACKSYLSKAGQGELYKSVDLDEIRARARRAHKARRVNLHSGLDVGDK